MSSSFDIHEFLYTHNYNDPTPSGIYAIVCVETGGLYVGSTKNLTERISHHFKLLEQGIHPNRDFQYSFTTHGPSRFTAVVLERCTARYLMQNEQKWLNRLRGKAFNKQWKVTRPDYVLFADGKILR